MPRLCSSLLLSLLIASSASALTMEWTPVGSPGNACDPQPQGCFGAVAYDYYIGTYEVTNAQYTEFLNAKAAADPFRLYNENMQYPTANTFSGGITRSGVSGSYTYSAIPGRENMPVNHVSTIDAMRFANWMNNGQGSGSTENGAYTLLGARDLPTNIATVTRSPTATIALSSENEWYKAAYYDAVSASYFDYPAGSNTPTLCSTPTSGANHANCDQGAVGLFGPTDIGSYTGSPSPYGTLDQGGNVWEWNETILIPFMRGIRGGSYFSFPGTLEASYRLDLPVYNIEVTTEGSTIGFRLMTFVPEPSTGLLVIAGLLGVAGWRRGRA